ncbi:MAG: hypothetical protein ABIZ34_10395, partial [Candidatus Limnocylindrales bacterium]
ACGTRLPIAMATDYCVKSAPSGPWSWSRAIEEMLRTGVLLESRVCRRGTSAGRLEFRLDWL